MDSFKDKLIVRVIKGAHFLDKVKKGWHKKVKLSLLDLGDCKNCILGQLEGDYNEALPRMGLTGSKAIRLGFQLDDDDQGEAGFEPLSDVWRHEIIARREAK